MTSLGLGGGRQHDMFAPRCSGQPEIIRPPDGPLPVPVPVPVPIPEPQEPNAPPPTDKLCQYCIMLGVVVGTTAVFGTAAAILA
jgi:hypothetical protein